MALGDLLSLLALLVSIVLSFLTLLVSTVGWVYVARKQSDLAKQVRDYQLVDREVQAFRSRLPIVSEFTSHLTRVAHLHGRMAGRVKFGIGQAGALSKEINDELRLVSQIQNNPEYMRLRDQLSSGANQELNRSMNELSRTQGEYSARFGDLHPENSAEHDRLVALIPDEALKVSNAYIATAGTIARVFAELDARLSAP